MVKISRDHLQQVLCTVVEPQVQHAGRNNNGHIDSPKVVVISITIVLLTFVVKDGFQLSSVMEYDPNRSAHIALICYADGERVTSSPPWP
jgi:large subunit ribosomal protein L2